jgi:HK97 gp10 family phage protein
VAEVKGVAEVARRLRALPPALGSKGGGPLRYALFQAAKVVRDEAKRRAPKRSGQLRDNIIAKRHRNPKAVGATERYDIGLKGGTRKLANNVRNRRARTAGAIVRTAGSTFYGRFLELGTAKMSAKPFLRPAIEAKQGAAVEAFRVNFLKAVEKAEAKLGRGG